MTTTEKIRIEAHRIRNAARKHFGMVGGDIDFISCWNMARLGQELPWEIQIEDDLNEASAHALTVFARIWASLGSAITEPVTEIITQGADADDDINPNAIKQALRNIAGRNEQIDDALLGFLASAGCNKATDKPKTNKSRLWTTSGFDLVNYANAWADMGWAVTEQVDMVLTQGATRDDDINPNAIDFAAAQLSGYNEEIDAALAAFAA